MRSAAVTASTTDARALSGRSSDAAQQDDAFDSTLAELDQAHPASSASAKSATPTGESAQGTAGTDAGQGIAALLAKLTGSASSPLAGGQAATMASDGSSTATGTSEKADGDATGTTVGAVDPLASMLLAGFAAAVAQVAVPSRTTVETQAESTNFSRALGGVSTSKAGKDSLVPTSGTTNEETPAATTNVGLSVVGFATHLAPSTPAGDIKVSSVSTTHEAASDAAPTADVDSHAVPAASLPDGTLQAIAGAVTSLANDAAASTSGDSAATAAAAQPTTTPATVQLAPARSLTLQLSPENLGSVTVRLHLNAGGLDVHLAVDDSKTLASISHARDDLAQAIGGSGYRVESLVIRGADASSTSTAGSNDSARSQSNASAGGGFSGGGSSGSGGDASSRERPAQAAAARDSGRDRGADGVFV